MPQASPQQSGQRCGRCKLYLPVESFSPSYRGKRGTWCKACFAEYQRHRKAGTSPPAAPDHDPVPCNNCGKEFRPRQVKAQPEHFCSRWCKDRARKDREIAARTASRPADRQCVHCGQLMPQAMRIDAKFCSEQCNSAAGLAAPTF